MKAREQKIRQAIKLYYKFNQISQTSWRNKASSDTMEYIIKNVNNHNPNFVISNDCNPQTMTVDEFYAQSMKSNIIYL